MMQFLMGVVSIQFVVVVLVVVMKFFVSMQQRLP
jgi:hypothetical protein